MRDEDKHGDEGTNHDEWNTEDNNKEEIAPLKGCWVWERTVVNDHY